ncbi:MAG: metal ABC transporter permease [Phycisphaerae bacterium]|nr:metal ABC transporter permease [Phycisphaerae bacterium]
MQFALLAGILVAILASYLGVFVVQRRLSFLGSGLAHAAFGGVAMGLLLQWEPLWVAVPFTVIVAVAITWVTERTAIGGDTSVGIFFSVSVALGVVFLSLRKDFSADAFSYLFGSILYVMPADLWLALGLLLIVLLTLPLWSRWAYATFDRELAQADNVRVSAHDYILSILVAVVIVVSVKLVGIMLIAAFVVIPPATSRLVVRTFAGMTLLAMILAVLGSVSGLWLSYEAELPSGGTIILVQAALFFIAAIATAIARRGKSHATVKS